MQNTEDAENLSNHTQDQSRSDSDDERNRVTEFFSSIRNGNLYAVRKLLEGGVKTDVIDKNNKDNTPLHYAVEKCRTEIVEELLLPKWKTDVNAKNSKGNTPLHIAASKGNRDLVRLVLNRRPKIHVKNHENKTPLDLTNDTEIHDILNTSYVLSLNSALGEKTKLRYQSQPDTYSDRPLSSQQSPLNDNIPTQKEQDKKKQQTFPRRPGTSNNDGHLYEIHICTLLLLQALEKREDGEIKTFRLAANVDGLENFDDIFFEYSYEDQDGKERERNEKSKSIFLQAKHIDQVEKKKITASVLLSQSKTNRFKEKFGLKKYFDSYRSIKQEFSKNEDHPIFSSQFEDSDREFIIYTNALSDFSENHNIFYKSEVGEEHILYLGNTMQNNNCYELIFSGNEIDKVINTVQCSSHRDQGDNTVTLSDGSTKRKKHKTTGNDSLKTNIIPEEISGQNCKLQSNSATGTEDKRKSNDIFETSEEPFTSSENSSIEKSEVEEFLKRLKIFVHQPNETVLSDIIKEKIQLFYGLQEQDATSVFSEVKTKVENWWKDKKYTKNFLTEDNRFFQDAVRVSILFDVKKPVDFFTGRSQDLINLHNLIHRSGENVAPMSKITVISGLGGIGKTELARKYISKHRGCYDDNVIWINAESESSLTESFILLARDKIRINTRNSNEELKDIKIILNDVYTFFRKRRSLFVFDNSDKSELLREFLPHCPVRPGQHEPYILITSRDQEWQPGVEVVPLYELKTEDATEFVKKGLDISGEDISHDQEITDLVTKLQYFPLAIRQAIAYIADQNKTANFSVSNYLTEYEERKKEILNSEISSNSIDNDYTKTTFTTWKITVDKIRSSEQCGQLALLILNIIAYFRSENIKREIFLCLANNDQRKLRSAVRLLVKYSLIRGEQKQSVLCVHTLVQEVIRLQLKESEEEEEILTTALKLMTTRIDSETVNHAVSLFNYASAYKKLMKKYAVISCSIIFELIHSVRYDAAYSFATEVLKLLQELCTDCSDICTIELFTKNSIGIILYGQGKYDESLKIWKELYVIQKETFGENDVAALDTKRSIGKALFAQGKLEEALKNCEEILDAGKELLTEDHELMLLIKHDRAKIWVSQSKYDQAFESLKEVLTTEEHLFGRNGFQTLDAKEAIADVLVAKDEYKEALNIYRELYEIKKSIFGDGSRAVLKLRKEIAGIITRLGEYNDALALYNAILNIENTYFAEDRLTILSTKHRIADVLRRTGDNAKAYEISEEVFRERKEMLGADHLSTLDIEQSVADVLNEIGECSKAFEHYKNVLEHRIRILGSDNAEVLTTLNCMGNLLLKQGKYQQALPIVKDVYRKRKSLLGELHIDTLISKNNVAMALLENGKNDEALRIYGSMLNSYKTVFGEKHPYVFSTNNNIAEVLLKKGEAKKALELFEQVFRDRVNSLGDTHPDTLTAQRNIAASYIRLHKPDKALNILHSIMNIQKRTNDYSVLDTECHIATAWHQKGNYDVALNIYHNVLDKRIEAYGETHPKTLAIRSNIGSEFISKGKYKEGLKIYRKVLKNQREILCPQHPDIIKTVAFLDKALKMIGWTRLHLAAYDGDETEITSLLDEGHDINCRTKDGFKPLHLAVENNNKETVGALISYSKKNHPQQLCSIINDKAENTGQTALHMGVSNDNKEIVEILLRNGAYYDLYDKRGKFPVDLAKTGSDVQKLLRCIDSLFTAVKNGKED